jgi:GTP-binding protein
MTVDHRDETEGVPSPAEREAAEAVFARSWGFLKSVPALEFLPDADRPEIAFAGRSNVGKSSLINALCNQSGLARSSNTPGRTQELNYFLQPSTAPKFFLVDMPGYGFAEAPKAKVEAWTELVKDYLRGRTTLARVMLLIDARHGPRANDRDIMKLLDEAAVSFQAVLTKVDKIKAHAVPLVIAATVDAMRKHPAAFPHVLATSAETGDGMTELRATIVKVVAERS